MISTTLEAATFSATATATAAAVATATTIKLALAAAAVAAAGAGAATVATAAAAGLLVGAVTRPAQTDHIRRSAAEQRRRTRASGRSRTMRPQPC